jgi:predicted acyltransferase
MAGSSFPQSPVASMFDATAQPLSGRLLSMDVFRGLAVAGMILVDNPGDDLRAYSAIRHTVWNGWSSADLIFPSFLFMVGISLVFSYSARQARGETRQSLFRHAITRTLILMGIGLFLNAFPTFEFRTMRFEGVLQRIALCYLVAAVLVLWTGWRGQLAALLVCLLGYWALMRFVPVPGFGVPGRDIPFLDPDRNIVAWLDRKLFMGHLFNDTRDPEGIISTIPSIATTLVGVLTGHWLRTSRSLQQKAGFMLLAGMAGLGTGLILDRWFPINKNLWTSSFAIFAGGFSLMATAVLFWVLEIKRWRGSWTAPLLVFGMNAIVGFAADALVGGLTYTYHAQLPAGKTVLWQEYANFHLLRLGMNPENTSLLYSALVVMLCLFLLWPLYRKRIFIKI